MAKVDLSLNCRASEASLVVGGKYRNILDFGHIGPGVRYGRSTTPVHLDCTGAKGIDQCIGDLGEFGSNEHFHD
uniref:Uncharacterized protein n=1 Tax=Candidatus Kentrum sp. LFY TaxID=2126342 RepID=A0A450UHQ9_9GAMM|nr:MAG: hypothetical protein BECKLFY1418A_GA0070994_102024 [Candidatus Kentron sp. LFY]